jgi:DnaJ-class molecular chaperone
MVALAVSLLSRERVATVCITCQGKGWIAEQQRTLDFDQRGFVDGPQHTHICAACGGTGTILR